MANMGGDLPPRVNCKECQEFLDQPQLDHAKIFDLQKNLAGIDEGARRGCEVCLVQVYSWTAWDRHWFQDEYCVTSNYCYIMWDPNNFEYRLHFGVRYKAAEGKSHIPGSSDRRIVLAPVTSTAQAESETDFNDRWDVVKYWIQNCRDKHDRCAQHERGGFVPSRLVEIVDGTEGAIKLRLRIADEMPTEVAYCTLSHCWGKVVPFKLTTKNLNDLRQNIDFVELSKTFADAVTVAKNVGIRYIWIDSLCIEQDSEKDWNHESALMAKIYQQSVFNIAATRSSDGSGGCMPRTTFRKSPPLVKARSLDVRAAEKRLGFSTHANENVVDLTQEFTWAQTLWQGGINRAPLTQRARVFQELILAPRVLHCDEHQFFWECKKLRACEDFPFGIPDGEDTSPIILSNDQDPYKIWHDRVSQYSRLSLTFPKKDQLVAISGLARRLGLQSEDYFAGLWRQNLEHDLMWFVQHHLEVSDWGRDDFDNSILPGPSWSWVSSRKRIMYREEGKTHDADHETGHLLAEIVGIHRDFDGDPFISTAPITLDIIGTIGTALFRKGSDYENRGENQDRIQYADSSRFCGAHFDRDVPPTNTTVQILPVLMRQNKMAQEKLGVYEFNIDGLIVEPTGNAPGEYRRLGFFMIWDSCEAFKICFKHSKGERDDAVQCHEYLGLDSHGFSRYKISLV